MLLPIGAPPAPVQGFLAAISFLEACRRQEQLQAAADGTMSNGGGLTPEAASRYLLLLENALLPAAPVELHAAALGAMLAVAAAQQSAFAAAYAGDAGRQALLLRLLGHVDAGARLATAQLLGLLVAHLGDPSGAQILNTQGPARVAGLCEALLSTLRAGGAEGAKSVRQEQLEGAVAAAGYVAAQLIQGEGKRRRSRKRGKRGAACLLLAACLLQVPPWLAAMPGSCLPSRMLPPLLLPPSAGTPAAPQDLLLSLLSQLRLLLDAPATAAPAAATTTSGGSSLRAGAALALGVASLPLAPPPRDGSRAAGGASGQPQLVLAALPDASGVVAATAVLLEDKDPKVVKKAAAALGYLCWGHSGEGAEAAATAGAAAISAPPEGAAGTAAAPAAAAASASASASVGSSGVLQPAVTALLALRTSKNEEVLFAAGEALCFCFGGTCTGPPAAAGWCLFALPLF